MFHFGCLLLFKHRLIHFFPVWVFQFGSKLKLESISSVADSVKPKSLFLICDFQNSQVLAVLQFHWCDQHPPPSEHSTTTRLKMSPDHVSVVRGWFCCLVAAFGSGSPPGARMLLSAALSPSLGLWAVPGGGQGQAAYPAEPTVGLTAAGVQV